MLHRNFFSLPENNKFAFILIALFPIFLIIGNLFINLFYICISILSLFNLKKKKEFINSTIFYLLIIFLICILANIIFSINPVNSFPRLIKFILIILFIKEMNYVLQKDNSFFSKILKFWSLIYLIVSLDIIFEIIFGFNTLGNRSPIWGRISSFFGDELVVGAFYHFFSLLILSFILVKKNSYNIIIFLAAAIITISFFIGERSNFIRLFISILLFLFLTLKIKLFKKTGVLILILFILAFAGLNNENLNKRYYQQLKILNTPSGFTNYYKNSQYGAHYSTALKIFKDNIFFGVGIKNFRIESKKDDYKDTSFSKTNLRQATHPHQIHFELLSETGIIGYFAFLLLITYSLYSSILNFKKTENYYQLSTIMYLITSIIPLLPTGSLFSTFYGGLFWFNFGLMISFNNYAKS